MKQISTSEFAEKILGLKLHKYQKEFLDKADDKKYLILARKSGNGGLQYYALIEHFYHKYLKNTKVKK